MSKVPSLGLETSTHTLTKTLKTKKKNTHYEGSLFNFKRKLLLKITKSKIDGHSMILKSILSYFSTIALLRDMQGQFNHDIKPNAINPKSLDRKIMISR